MSQVHAPYHFVPLSKWVYMPDWAHLVSHDHPFEDGYSGVIDIELKNISHLCVANSQSDEALWQRTPCKKHLVIPGSSIKGMLRNILEIASFGKFDHVDNNHFSYRDFTDKSYQDNIMEHDCESGWLKYDVTTNQWFFTQCKHTKVRHSLLKQQVNISHSIWEQSSICFNSYLSFPLKNNLYFNTNKTVLPIEKYENFKIYDASDLELNASNKNQSHIGKLVFSNYRPKVLPTIPDTRNKKPNYNDLTKSQQKIIRDRTEFSYIFYDQASNSTPVPKDVIDDFFSSSREQLSWVNKKTQVTQKTSHLEFLQKNQESTLGIPVFARLNERKLIALGLSKLARKKYKNSINDSIKNTHPYVHSSNSVFGLAEIMFGNLRQGSLSLKSRISFTDLVQKEEFTETKKYPLTLTSPKATFTNTYISQSEQEEINTYDTNDCNLAGWKRYIARNQFEAKNISDKKSINSNIEFIPPGASFKGSLYFNNLKKEEIGALLWAIQLGNKDDQAYTKHALGSAKAYGAGTVDIEIIQHNFTPNNPSIPITELEDFVESYEKKMTDSYPSRKLSWRNSPQILHLLGITDNAENQDRQIRHYKVNDYRQLKKESRLAPISFESKKVSTQEPHDLQEFTSNSFARGRLAGLLCEEQDNWCEYFLSKQESMIKKEEQKYEKERLKNIVDPTEKCIGESTRISKLYKQELTSTERRKLKKDYRELYKLIRELSFSSSQKLKLISLLEDVNFKERPKLMELLKNE